MSITNLFPVPGPDQTYGLTVVDNEIQLRIPERRKIIDSLRERLPIVHWGGKLECWLVPYTHLPQAVAFAQRWNLPIADGLAEKAADWQSELDRRIAASRAVEPSRGFTVECHAPTGLRPMQLAGIEYMIEADNFINADVTGKGKTRQTLVTVNQQGKFPLVVVTTNSGKAVWRKEIVQCFPDRTWTVVNGIKPEAIEPADLVIINYDICDQRMDDLLALKPQSAVLDEMHKIKNGRPKYYCPECNSSGLRSNAKNCGQCHAHFDEPVERWTVRRCHGVMRLMNAIPEGNPRGGLTATIAPNGRAAELIPQLIAVDMMKHFGTVTQFQNRYCPGGQGGSHLVELHERLRAYGMVRRTDADTGEEQELILDPLPIPMSAENFQRYRQIEADVVIYLAERARAIAEEAERQKWFVATGKTKHHDLTEDVQQVITEAGRRAYIEKEMRASAAEHLVRITTLRNALAELKLDVMAEWIDDWLDGASPEEKMLVFGEHISLVDSLKDRYGDAAVKLRGGMSTKRREIVEAEFQTDPNVRLFVANMVAAGESLTLTAGHHVAFTELPWNWDTLVQCWGRCYARTNDMHGATVHFLVAPDTIDEDTYRILLKKKVSSEAVSDGTHPDAQESVLSDLIVALTRRGMGWEDPLARGEELPV